MNYNLSLEKKNSFFLQVVEIKTAEIKYNIVHLKINKNIYMINKPSHIDILA